MSRTIATVLVAVLCAILCAASNVNKPHNHEGKVTPFEPGHPEVVLDAKAEKTLKEGKPYQTQIQSGSRGRGLVVQDINAPVSVVWGRIFDFDNYANMVPKTTASKNYEVIDHKATKKSPLAKTIFTRMKIGVPLFSLEFFVKHSYFPMLNSLTWTLDYTKKSDLDDSCGYWYVIPHPDSPGDRTRVYYSVEVSLFDWVPNFVLDMFSNKALTDATAWVKKFSEKKVAEEPSKNEGKKAAKKRKNRGLQIEEITTTAKAEPTGSTVPVRWTRVGLVTLVSTLVLYNLSLFAGQFRSA